MVEGGLDLDATIITAPTRDDLLLNRANLRFAEVNHGLVDHKVLLVPDRTEFVPA